MCETREAPRGTGAATCTVCPRRCRLAPGALGACRARRNVNGHVVDENYGRVTALALDPVEKKPLARWRPGTLVLSLGSYGCNLTCPFCQNHDIAQVGAEDVRWREVSPAELVGMAVALREQNPQVAGIAYTYNEPLVGWEYVRDCARLAHEAGLANVLVSNGMAAEHVVRELAPLIDAANIDLKGFSAAFYQGCVTGVMPQAGRDDVACASAASKDKSNGEKADGAGKAASVRCDARGAGDKDNVAGISNRPDAEARNRGGRNLGTWALACVKRTLELLAREPDCHLEVTTLVVPGLNDTEEEIGAMAQWLAALDYREEPNPRAAAWERAVAKAGTSGSSASAPAALGAVVSSATAPGSAASEPAALTYHVTRFFPRWHLADRGPTPVADVRRLADVARRHLPYVYVGNC